MKEFAHLVDAGRQLGERIAERVGHWSDPILTPVLPNGVPVVEGIRDRLHLPVRAIDVRRADEGVVVEPVADLVGRTAIVVDDGVETGTIARAVAPIMREGMVAHLVLAVPVCSREVLAHLALVYDEVIAVSTPLVRRSLTWHYEDFDTVDEQEARRRLAELPA